MAVPNEPWQSYVSFEPLDAKTGCEAFIPIESDDQIMEAWLNDRQASL
jgi:hypothetical protein